MPRGVRILLALPLAVTIWSGGVSARIYKWVDEHGIVHYSDSVPPDEADERRRREIKSEAGRTVDVLEPAPTREQIEARAAAEAARRRAAEAAARQAERDRILLRTFSTVEDIEAARDGRLQAIEGRIGLTEARMEKLQARLASLRDEAARLERSGDADPSRVYDKIEVIRQRLGEHRAYIDKQRAAQAQIRSEFARDIRRFRELTAR